MDSDLDAVPAFVGISANSAMFVHAPGGADNAMLNTSARAPHSPFGMNNSATGHLLLDALMLMAVPLVLQFLLSPAGVKEAWHKLRAAVLGDENAGYVFRDIKAKTSYGKYWIQDVEENRFGHLLQKAIMAHLAEMLQSKLRGKDVQYEMVEKEIEADAAQMLEDTKKTPKPDDFFFSNDDGEAKQYEAINRLRVGSMPKLGNWIEVQPKVFFMRCIESESDDSSSGGDSDDKAKVVRSKDVTTLFRFKSNATGGSRLIDKLIDDAFVKYQLLELAELANDRKKYMYVQTQRVAPAPSDDDSDGGGGDSTAAAKTPVVVYKRYVLGEEKTFDNLFFDEKPALVQLLDNFLHKTGKFAITGFPYKLGLLLHGPPGTGKTSLIKAVAHHTKRHIVTISLGKIKTNQELMNALFDLRFTVEGVALPVNMTFEDVVFVMEDIDCAASVVMARGDGKAGRTRRHRTARSSHWGGGGGSSSSSSSANDKLNLSGLLNVLDGVIDCPGRIVIMTTNHPEKLDPALIRPGRISKKLELGYMSGRNIQTMVEYYSQAAFTREQELALEALLSEDCAKPVTPATVEALSAEFDDIDSVLEALKVLQAAPDGRNAWLS